MKRPRRVAFALAGTLAVVAAACGTANNASSTTSSTATGGDQLAVAPASYDLAVGPPARFIVGLFTADKTNIGYGTIHLKFTYLGLDGKQHVPGTETDATFLQIPGSATRTPPAGPAKLSYEDGRGVYSATVGFDKAGFWQVDVDTDIKGVGRRSAGGNFEVLAKHGVLAPGDSAIASDNATLDTPGVAPMSLDSRAGAKGKLADIPDADLHRTTIKSALAAHRPAVVVFATPVYCVSQFCGPVTDMVNDLAHTYRDRADFIHVEIWKDYEKKELNPTATEWIDRDEQGREPWVFVIGADGKITNRFDNVTTKPELEAVLQGLPK